MTTENNSKFKVGDEVWWFKVRANGNSAYGMGYCNNIDPDTIELVHDVVTDIQDESLICWHGTHRAKEIWGKTRQEAWSRLKKEIEKWGAVE